MADFWAGLLTSSIVNIAKGKLASIIANQANLLWNFSEHLRDMDRTLETISAVLQDAERRSVTERLVQLWMKRLKNAALDISDMLDDYQDTSDRLTTKMPRALSWLPIAHKKISLANRMKSIREELKNINKEFQDFHFTQGTTGSIEQHDDVRETASRLFDKEIIIGRNVEKQEIINMLAAGTNNNEQSSMMIVAIYGLGGMGKSTLAQQIYHDHDFKKYDKHAWVYVSRDFSLKKIGSSIISQLQREEGQQNRDTLEAIMQGLATQLRGQKVLIVLDDLWEENIAALGNLRSLLRIDGTGTMIDVIVTTRDEYIARNISTTEPYKLQPLKDDTCWEIIKRTSEFENKHNKETLEQIGLGIAEKCGGMALAAQAVGYLLRYRDLSGWTEINNSDIWNESSEVDDGVLPSLKLSYEWMLPRLRICFSYCAIFPKGHNIAEDDLIHQWVALDFIQPSMGKKYITRLLGMSFLQVTKLPSTSGNRMTRYTMHDLVHDLATLVMGDECTSIVASNSNNRSGYKYCRYALVKKCDQTINLSKNLPLKLRALHFSDSGKLDLISAAFKFAKFLRILDFSGCRTSILLPASIGQLKQLKYLVAPRIQNENLPGYITKLSKLQYLNLNGSARISALPESIGKLSECLKYLRLSGCSGISNLPESFCDLRSMMHLDMSGCSGIRELPDSLGNLTNLQCLQLSACSRLEAIPESFPGLRQLQHLNISACDRITRLPEAIGNLVNLQYLNMAGCGIKELPESFKRLSNLLHLDMNLSRVREGLLGALCGLTALQYLDMSMLFEDMEEGLPVAMRNLTNLSVLNLSWSVHKLFGVVDNVGSLDFLGALTNLKHLDLSHNVSSWYLPESIGNLKGMHTLNLEGCSRLMSLPQSIRGASQLKSLQLKRCSSRLIDQANSLLHYSLTLPVFKVRADDVNDGSNLHLLKGEDVSELEIASLENVRSLEEAQGLELSTKQNLLRLTLNWTWKADRFLEDKHLLGELVPPKGLKSLYLGCYRNQTFPSWFSDISLHLPNLTSIEMVALPNCTNLPPLGQLPFLQILRLRNLPAIQKIDSSICGCGGNGAFPRLAKFEVNFLEGWKEWTTTYPGENGVEQFMFPMLDVLDIFYCPRLRFKPCPPKCRQYSIVRSDQVISSLEDLGTLNSTETTSLTIGGDIHSFRLFHHFPVLQELCFSGCTNLRSLPEGIKQLPSLQTLKLSECYNIAALPEWLGDISSLRKLTIWECTSIKSLPQCIQQLTNLQELLIYSNQELQQWCESEENKAKLAHIKDRIYRN